MKKCKQCGSDVPQTQGKKTKQYCDDKCRQAYSRANRDKANCDKPNRDIKPEQIQPEQSKANKCYGCGEQGSELIDICYKCIALGHTRDSLGLELTARQKWLNECV